MSDVNTFSISDTHPTSLAQIAMNCEKRGVGLREMMDDIIAKDRVTILKVFGWQYLVKNNTSKYRKNRWNEIPLQSLMNE